MIIGLGIDSIEIERFSHWHQLPKKSLQRLFAEDEIAYCLQNNTSSIQRFAAHFAAREAFFKALCAAYPTYILPFLFVCRLLELTHQTNHAPTLLVNWNSLSKKMGISFSNPPITLISITHTRTVATACVLLQKNSA